MGASRGQGGLKGSGGSGGGRFVTRRSLSPGITRVTDTAWGAHCVPARNLRALLARDDREARHNSRGRTARVRLGPSPPLLHSLRSLEEESCTVDAYIRPDCAAKSRDNICCGCPVFKNGETTGKAGRTQVYAKDKSQGQGHGGSVSVVSLGLPRTQDDSPPSPPPRPPPPPRATIIQKSSLPPIFMVVRHIELHHRNTTTAQRMPGRL